jgi:hypothetical protein
MVAIGGASPVRWCGCVRTGGAWVGAAGIGIDRTAGR